MKRKKNAPVKFGASSPSKKSKNGRRKMNSNPRTVEISVDNYYSAIETFLRSMKEIRNDENVKLAIDWDTPRHADRVLIKITPQEVTQDKTTVH